MAKWTGLIFQFLTQTGFGGVKGEAGLGFMKCYFSCGTNTRHPFVFCRLLILNLRSNRSRRSSNLATMSLWLCITASGGPGEGEGTQRECGEGEGEKRRLNIQSYCDSRKVNKV